MEHDMRYIYKEKLITKEAFERLAKQPHMHTQYDRGAHAGGHGYVHVWYKKMN